MSVILDKIHKLHTDKIDNEKAQARYNNKAVFSLGNKHVKHITGDYRIDYAYNRNRKGCQHIERKYFLVWFVIL